MAHVASGICLSRTWSAGERTDASAVFLRDRDSRSGVFQRLAGSFSSCTFCRARRDGWDCGRMGDSIRLQHDLAGCDGQVVGSVHGTVEKQRFQILRLDPKRSPRPHLLSSMASPVSVCAIFKIAGAKRPATRARSLLGNCSAVFGCESRPWRAPPIQHAGNSSSIVAAGNDLRRERIAIPATLDQGRTHFG